MKNEIVEAVKSIKTAILQSRYLAAKSANKEQLRLYFYVGAYISENTRNKKWGSGALEKISNYLQVELPGLRGFSEGNMKKMRLFFEEWLPVFEYEKVRKTLIGDLTPNRALLTHDFESFCTVGFTHHYEILKRCKSINERLYYINETAKNFWTVETLKRHLAENDFVHNGRAINNFSITIPNENQASRAIMAFKDEMLLDYINIEDVDDNQDVDERVLEREIINNIKKFIQSLGTSFCFIGNQHRIVVDDEEYFIDLLFYNRELKSLVAIELKKGKFKPAYLGQLNFYLSALDKYEKQEGENPSIGLLLCHEMNKTVVQLAVQDFSKPIGVATYKTPKDIPEKYKALKPIVETVPKLLEDSAGCSE